MSALDTQKGGGHYKGLAIQPVEYIHANGLPFIEGCVIKYVTRWKAKGGVQDLEKARHFIDLLIELEQRSDAQDSLVFPDVGCSTLPRIPSPAELAAMEDDLRGQP